MICLKVKSNVGRLEPDVRLCTIPTTRCWTTIDGMGPLAEIESLGLESFIEAKDMRMGLYAGYGYRPVKVVNVDV